MIRQFNCAVICEIAFYKMKCWIIWLINPKKKIIIFFFGGGALGLHIVYIKLNAVFLWKPFTTKHN